ncbi:hypothetical protein C1H46_028632 [Malus baccata]|uniref:Uncharacterized protein n=1 Tax=Malus baccata TaxID=106549 RepID=A0A540LH68_MALBA|nr:hypothetical protein C1H46_028632 [Malus baccata]
MEGYQAVDVQQNKAEVAKLWKTYKEEIDQEYNLGYLAGYTGQGHHDKWHFAYLLEKIWES